MRLTAIAEQALRPNQTIVPERINATLGFPMNRTVYLIAAIVFVSGCSHAVRVEPYVKRLEDALYITGAIDLSLTYAARVSYIATAQSKSCKTYNFKADIYVSSSRDYYYAASVDGESHRMVVPLKELDPSANCAWKPYWVFVCVTSRESDPTKQHTCSSAFRITEETTPVDESVTNLACRPPYWFCNDQMLPGFVDTTPNTRHVINFVLERPLDAMKHRD